MEYNIKMGLREMERCRWDSSGPGQAPVVLSCENGDGFQMSGIIRICPSFQSMCMKESILGRNYFQGCFEGENKMYTKCFYGAKA
jgi:hypothetical protein